MFQRVMNNGGGGGGGASGTLKIRMTATLKFRKSTYGTVSWGNSTTVNIVETIEIENGLIKTSTVTGGDVNTSQENLSVGTSGGAYISSFTISSVTWTPA